MLCDAMGYDTGIDMSKLLEAVALLSDMIGAPQGGRGILGSPNSARDLVGAG